jgi:3-deoxy-D-manno-octulosonic-acid transferase
LVLDTLGELTSVYAAADVAVIGGGFAKLGGQNLIQPLAHGVPVLHGPHMHNFRDVTSQADEAGCALMAPDAASLAKALVELRGDEARRNVMGEAAKTLVQANLGASDRYAAAIVAAARSSG